MGKNNSKKYVLIQKWSSAGLELSNNTIDTS